MEQDVVIRRFDATRDAEALRACVIDQQDYHRGIEPAWPGGEAIADEYMTYLEAQCALHAGCILLAHDGGHAVGFVCVLATVRGEAPDDPVPFAWVHDVYVKPDHRGRDIGSQLMAEAERFARSEGAHTLRLGVLAGNELARRFYRARGFREYTHVLTKSLVEP